MWIYSTLYPFTKNDFNFINGTFYIHINIFFLRNFIGGGAQKNILKQAFITLLSFSLIVNEQMRAWWLKNC